MKENFAIFTWFYISL